MLLNYCSMFYLSTLHQMRWDFVHFHDNSTIVEYDEFEGPHQDHQVQLQRHATISTGTSRFVSHNYYGSGVRKCLVSKNRHNPIFRNKWKVHSKGFYFPIYIQFKQRQNLKYLCVFTFSSLIFPACIWIFIYWKIDKDN